MDDITCSFCGKRRSEVRKLISGPNVYVCDECVSLCNEIIEQEDVPAPREYPRPREIKDYLDTYVIGQDDAKQPPEGFPGLTTVRFSHSEVGYLAAELLLRQVESNEVVHGNIRVRSYLIERESCCEARRA